MTDSINILYTNLYYRSSKFISHSIWAGNNKTLLYRYSTEYIIIAKCGGTHI